MADEHGHREYDQSTDLDLLISLLGQLENKIVVDVGAETGSFVSALLKAGAEAIYAFEPFPNNVSALRAAFNGLPTVRVSDVAIGARDEATCLHVVEDKSAGHPDAFH